MEDQKKEKKKGCGIKKATSPVKKGVVLQKNRASKKKLWGKEKERRIIIFTLRRHKSEVSGWVYVFI